MTNSPLMTPKVAAMLQSLGKAMGQISMDHAVTLLAAFLGAALASAIAVFVYQRQQKEGRRLERARMFANALRSVEDYLEAPYRILRSDGSAASRNALTESISEIQSRLRFYAAWMEIDSSEAVRMAYKAFVQAARTEAGAQMTAAWQSKGTRRNKSVPLGKDLDQPTSKAMREKVLKAMKSDLGT